MGKPIIVSGIQPTGNLHIGNYLGAVKNWVDLQESGKYQMFIFIADLHSLTGTMSAEQRREQTVVTAAELIASGIDPKKTTLFIQSEVKEHTELAWIFNTITPIAELERMTQFKDKSARQEKNINAGLLTYPVLQAADILLYNADFVPIGQDQIQHLELTNEVARWYNNRYAPHFKEVNPLLTPIPKVMSLLEAAKKMSKSLGAGHVLELADDPDTITNKIKKAVTATEGGKEAPGVQNLLSLLRVFGGEKIYTKFAEDEKAGTIRYGDLKSELSKVVADYFAPFRAKRAELLKDRSKLLKVLANGAKEAQGVTSNTMERIKKEVGLS